ncbi:MAG: hypothetical protein KBB64_11480 [Bacteroidia bacterium]|jgi:hypothetical protein|nr:hypothetical protein [Bacteroidia bacterium]
MYICLVAKNEAMLMNEFCSGYFLPKTTEQQSLMDRYKTIRSQVGEPSKMAILRRLVRTRPFTRTVYPPNWKVA